MRELIRPWISQQEAYALLRELAEANLKDRPVTRYITPIDQAELICRMLEAGMGLRRPPGVTAAWVVKFMEPEEQEIWMRASAAAMDYWRECIDEMQAVS